MKTNNATNRIPQGKACSLICTLVAILFAMITSNLNAMTRSEAAEQLQRVVDNSKQAASKTAYHHAKSAVLNGGSVSGLDRRILENDLAHFEKKVPPLAEAVKMALGRGNISTPSKIPSSTSTEESHRHLTGGITKIDDPAVPVSPNILDSDVPTLTATSSQVAEAIKIVDEQVTKAGVTGGIVQASPDDKGKRGYDMLVDAATAGVASLRGNRDISDALDRAQVLIESAKNAARDYRRQDLDEKVRLKAAKVSIAYRIAAASLAGKLTVTDRSRQGENTSPQPPIVQPRIPEGKTPLTPPNPAPSNAEKSSLEVPAPAAPRRPTYVVPTA